MPDEAPLHLHPDVYEPAEDSELLVRVVRDHEPDLAGKRALDVGTGSGIVARALAEAGAHTVAVDLNPHAVEVARRNLTADAAVLRGDLMTALRGPFDVVTFNAPYLPSEEEERVEGWIDHAFHGGEEGVETSVRFVRDLPRLLAPEGRAYLVVSSRAALDDLTREIEALGFAARPLASVRFFFEEVAVWRISART